MAIPSAAVPTVDAMIEAAVDQANETFARMFTADDTASFPSSPAFSGSDVGKVSTTVDTTTLLMIGMSVVLVFSLLINVVVIACLLLNRRSSTLPAAPQPPSIQYVVSPPAAPAGRAVDMAEMIRSNATTVRRRPGARSPSPMPMKRSIYAAVPTMEEAAMMQAERNSEVKAKSPRDILEEIKAGNARFWTGESERPDMSLVERRALISGQVSTVEHSTAGPSRRSAPPGTLFRPSPVPAPVLLAFCARVQAPKVMVIGCADSRVPIEIVFDQGIGTCCASHATNAIVWRTAHQYRIYDISKLLTLLTLPCPCAPLPMASIQAMSLSCVTPATSVATSARARSTVSALSAWRVLRP